MRRHLLLAFMMLSAGSFSGNVYGQEEAKVRVHTIGDSTMADYVENTTRTRGWGEMLQEFFTSDVHVANYARGGRSSRSFYKEGLWQIVLDSLRPNDYVLIQFAHNDEKEGGKDGDDFRGTAPWTTYKKHLEMYVDQTRSKGATPVFVTPIIRRYFTSDGTISPKGCHDLSKAPDDSTLNYVRVMKHVARNKKVQLVDMTAMTREYAERLGVEQTIKCIYVPTDGTHTQATGAACYARLAVEGLRSLGILREYIRHEQPLVLNPTTLDFKTLFAGEEATVCFDLTGINLQPTLGRLTIEAPKGMTISDDAHGKRAASLSYDYEDGRLWNRCFYLFYTPDASDCGNVQTAVSITYGNQQRLLPVKAVVSEVKERSAVSIPLERIDVKGLQRTDGGITIEGGRWSAEIDEAQKRYVEVIVPASEHTLLLRQLSFTIEGDVAYRVACAYGKDFYPRTDVGESQQPVGGKRSVVCPANIMLRPGQRLHIRLYPWSRRESSDIHFSVGDWKVEGIMLR